MKIVYENYCFKLKENFFKQIKTKKLKFIFKITLNVLSLYTFYKTIKWFYLFIVKRITEIYFYLIQFQVQIKPLNKSVVEFRLDSIGYILNFFFKHVTKLFPIKIDQLLTNGLND